MKATAAIDGLTGIFNKRYLTQRLAEETTRALEESAHAALFMFDVDHFKVYNDQNGHVAGDRLLQSLARLVQDNLRRDTVFGRYGGEEFLIIFPNLRREQAMAAAENIRKAIAAYTFAHAGAQPLGCVSISGGVAECPLDGRNAVGLVRAADEALYRAKRAGRNRVLGHEPVYIGEKALNPDHTPEPGTLLALAMITPPQGVPSLAAALRNPEALTVALEAAAEAAPDERRQADEDEDQAKKSA
jgi:diguanylate cyclase (GGDEF)-like protein